MADQQGFRTGGPGKKTKRLRVRKKATTSAIQSKAPPNYRMNVTSELLLLRGKEESWGVPKKGLLAGKNLSGTICTIFYTIEKERGDASAGQRRAWGALELTIALERRSLETRALSGLYTLRNPLLYALDLIGEDLERGKREKAQTRWTALFRT